MTEAKQGMQLERKITVGGINGIRKGFKNVTARALVARIIGIANDAVREEGAMGEYVKFRGEFRAINQHGEEFAAPVAFLPSPADSMLETAVKGASGNGVQFGFDIFVVPNPEVAIGYEYKVQPLLESKPSDPLAALLGAVKPFEAQPLTLAKPATQGELPVESGQTEPAPAEKEKKKK